MKDGYITVYLSLVTGILLSLILTVVEGVRLHTIRSQTECVMDMAMDSALAEYHRELLEQYDLFFIDLSYGGPSPSFANAEEHIRSYMNMNFQPFQVFDIPVGKDLTALSADEVVLLQASVASDDAGAVLKRQAVDYVKNRWGLSYLNQAAVNAEVLGRRGYLDSDVEQRRLDTERQVKDKILQKQQQEDEDWEGQNVELPSDVVNQARGEGILGLASAAPGELSRTSIPVQTLLSHRGSMLEGTGLAEGKTKPSGISGNCLFQSYIMEKCGTYGEIKEHSAFSYQVEYILEGGGNDLDNLRAVADKILLVREAANAAYLFTDGAKQEQARGTALLISSVLGLPELTEPVTALILFAWAYAESVRDLRILFDGEKVPLVKTTESWNTPYSQLLTFRGHLSEYTKGQSGMSYRDYLGAFLYLQSEETTLRRLMDVMEADIRMTPGNENFRMDGCADAITAQASVKSGYGRSCQITRSYQYE
ncbi:MAG TPA: hypothetical protein H9717_16060 [Candidatus Eisenbergiella merdipullorum]|uniref:Uncharacterized protein n=1 Tax=Candidatus Eisenbergiella merdipullorum TaxID=2838553 RepID=A0A9D2I928_9FIRM|nr:hypothetical protein [Candidatus Eisenbergiella merdipullorum]